MECPICLTSDFKDFRSRPNIQCGSCGSLERHRSVVATAIKLGKAQEGAKVLHVSPDGATAEYLIKHVGAENYFPVAENPAHPAFQNFSQRTGKEVQPITFLDPNERELPQKFDLILSAAWLHITPAPWPVALNKLNRSLKEDGKNLLTAAVRIDCHRHYIEDHSDLTPEERSAKLGFPSAHVRYFGYDDLDKTLHTFPGIKDGASSHTLLTDDERAHWNIPDPEFYPNNFTTFVLGAEHTL